MRPSEARAPLRASRAKTCSHYSTDPVQILRKILLAMLFSLMFGFALGTLLRLRLDRPVWYLSENFLRTEAPGARARTSGGEGEGTLLRKYATGRRATAHTPGANVFEDLHRRRARVSAV